MAKLPVAWSTGISNALFLSLCPQPPRPFPFLPLTGKTRKAYSFASPPFLSYRWSCYIHLWPTDEHKSAMNFWRFCFYEKRIRCERLWLVPPFFSHTAYHIQYRHIALNCSGHLLLTRKRPKDSRDIRIVESITEPMSVAGPLDILCEKNKTLLKNHCYLDLLLK